MNRGCAVLLGALAAIPTAALLVLVAAVLVGCSTGGKRYGPWETRASGASCRQVIEAAGDYYECRQASNQCRNDAGKFIACPD